MHIGKLLGWGIAIYAIMYLVVAALAIYAVSPPLFARLIALLILISLATMAGFSLRRHTVLDILPYSFMWTAEVMLLDALMSVPFAGWQLYMDWNVWVGYSLVLIVPLLTVYGSHRTPASARV